MTENKKILLASNNQGKIREMNSLFKDLAIKIIPQSDLNIKSAQETGLSFVENAIIKARNAALHGGVPAIADDSGLEVPAINNKPGIYSARYAGINSSDDDNVNKLIEDIKPLKKQERIAYFVCVLVYMRDANDPVPIISQAKWEGQLITERKGVNGFGYDPIFFVPTHNCTSAELSEEVKNKISHRGMALRLLAKSMQKTP